MNLSWTCALVSILVCANALSEDELRNFITLTKFEYEDTCSKTAESEWAFINHPNETTRRLWETAANEFRLQKIKEVNATRAQNVTNFDDTTLEYAYNVVMKPGDALLESGDFHKLVSFVSQAETSRLTGYYTTATEKLFRQDVERRLARNEKAEDKLASWSGWHQTLAPLAANFSENLRLVQKAAVANGKSSVEEYWEMLSGFENGYQRAKAEWDKMRNLQSLLQKIVKSSLAKKYGISESNDSLPAHLLGSLRGDDWTNTAMDVVDHRDIVFDIRKNLMKKGIVGETLYKEASKIGNILLRHVPQADFWHESNFRGQCPDRLINLCRDGKIRVSTCSEASIGNFITAHKNVGKILVNQMSHDSDPILGIANRYSALEEGVAEFFGILSVSQAWLSTEGLIGNTTDSDDSQMVSLMMTALDVIPRMAYYLAADTWRIDAIRNETIGTNDLASTWWKYRLEYENVSTSVPDLPTFLDDDYVTGNKPYLAKFLGVMLGFQIYEHVMDSTEIRYGTVELASVQRNHQFSRMIRRGFENNWTDVIRKHLDVSGINADSMVSYFVPLTDHLVDTSEMDSWPERPSMSDEKDRELDAMQDLFRKKMNEPPTTTTQQPKINANKISKPVRPKPTLPAAVATKSSNTSVPVDPTISKNFEIPSVNETREISSPTENVDNDASESADEVPKKNQSKAVWAVGAVLAATVVICVILIFGKNRCRRAPKNRRYV